MLYSVNSEAVITKRRQKFTYSTKVALSDASQLFEHRTIWTHWFSVNVLFLLSIRWYIVSFAIFHELRTNVVCSSCSAIFAIVMVRAYVSVNKLCFFLFSIRYSFWCMCVCVFFAFPSVAIRSYWMSVSHRKVYRVTYIRGILIVRALHYTFFIHIFIVLNACQSNSFCFRVSVSVCVCVSALNKYWMKIVETNDAM